MAQTTPRFDPASHLTKQGWKGKGTALKAGHATRPIAVVQKKTLSGIGRDRDEAVPFWDHIFASTAASLFSTPSTSTTPTPSGTPPPSSWQTYHNTENSTASTSKVSMTPSLRASKEIAKRGLYSKFFRGKVVEPEEVEEVLIPSGNGRVLETVVVEEVEVEVDLKERDKGKKKRREGESEEERRIRRAAKRRRKEDPSGDDVEGNEDGVGMDEAGSGTTRTKRQSSKKRKKDTEAI